MPMQLSAFLQKINPTNSLFGKVFIWFWLSVSALVISAFLFARLTSPELDISEVDADKRAQAQRIAGFLQGALERGIPPERALRRIASRGPLQLALVNKEQADVILAFPAVILGPKRPLRELAESETIVTARTPNMEFVGPIAVYADAREYRLFVGRLLKRTERRTLPWEGALFIVLGIGSLMCLLLAWRLSKPLGELGKAVRAFADGDFRQRAKTDKKRRDEIGELANSFNSLADKICASQQQQQMLLVNVSHELRTPLTRLQLAVAILQEKYQTPDNDVDSGYLSRIELEIQTMDRLIAQILMLTRMQGASSGVLEVADGEFCKTELVSLLRHTIDNLAFESQAKQKQFVCEALPDINVYVNETALLSALENVTRNAIKFANSTVSLSFEILAERGANSQALAEASSTIICIHVDDDGEGLPNEQLDKLFQAFYQAPQRNQENARSAHSGTGLGLAIAKAAMHLHKGSIQVGHSKYGGLRFTLVLPVLATT